MKLALRLTALGILVLATSIDSRLAAQAGAPSQPKPAASAGSPTLVSDLVKDWQGQKDLMMKIADAMPEDKFGFKSTPAQRTYGEQVMHAGMDIVVLMRLVDPKVPAPDINEKTASSKTKAEILKALADAYDFGNTVLKGQTDATLQQTVQGPRFLGPSTGARIVWRTMGHSYDIYGQMAVYLRLNGVVPPASRGI